MPQLQDFSAGDFVEVTNNEVIMHEGYEILRSGMTAEVLEIREDKVWVRNPDTNDPVPVSPHALQHSDEGMPDPGNPDEDLPKRLQDIQDR